MRVLPGWLCSNLVYFSYPLNGCIVCVSCGWHVLTWTSFNVTLNVYRYMFKTQQTMVAYLKRKHLKNARWLTGFHGGKANNDRGPIISKKVIALTLLSLMRCCCWHRYYSLQLLGDTTDAGPASSEGETKLPTFTKRLLYNLSPFFSLSHASDQKSCWGVSYW